MDWREFVETMSVVEQMLREDPGGVYARMDFATRDRYRHVVEEIAKRSRAVRRGSRAQGDRSSRTTPRGRGATTGDDDATRPRRLST